MCGDLNTDLYTDAPIAGRFKDVVMEPSWSKPALDSEFTHQPTEGSSASTSTELKSKDTMVAGAIGLEQ
jgi:hypothetical protein